jgi:hypothetical protein
MTDCYIKIQIITEQNSKNDWRKSQNNRGNYKMPEQILRMTHKNHKMTDYYSKMTDKNHKMTDKNHKMTEHRSKII